MVLGQEVITDMQEGSTIVCQKEFKKGRTKIAHSNLFPNESDIKICAKKIIGHLQDGFQLRDIPAILGEIYGFFNKFPKLTVRMRVDVAKKTFATIIANTDTPLLPDRITDPLIIAMIDPFIELFCPDNIPHLKPTHVLTGTPTDAQLQEYEDQLFRMFKGKEFDWSCFAATVYHTASYIAQFRDLTPAQKESFAMSGIRKIIRDTNTPFFIDKFSDPLLEKFAHATVKYMIPALEKL